MHDKVHFLWRVYHRAIGHSHEIIVALMVEGARMQIVGLLLIVAAILLAFAAQIALHAED